MKETPVNQLVRWGCLGLLLSVSACSVLDGDKVNYRSATKAPTLEVPPDLTQLGRDGRYTVPGGSVSASSYQSGPTVPVQAIASRSAGDVRIERAGNQQWLVVNRPAEQLWDSVRDFWQESGFVLTSEQATIGVMETDWAENRAKIPQDFIRNTIGKVLDSLYSSGEQDRFRTRFERNATGGTEIFISHRGMVEVYDSSSKDRTVWQPRPANAELEAEFLKRLMLKLGGPAAATQVAAGAPASPLPALSQATTVGGQPAVLINEGFDRAWRRVGLSLDRTGFTVEDRDRAKGTYFVRYVEPGTKKEEPGFFAKLFSSSAPASAPLKLRIVLTSAETSTTVTVQNTEGKPETASIAQRIVKVITDDLK